MEDSPNQGGVLLPAELVISQDIFQNRIEVRPKRSFALFLGSGTSVQSGIPTGGQLVWDFKRRLYCNHHKVPVEKFRDLESSDTQRALRDFVEAQGMVPPTESSEYSYFFEKCFQTGDDRKYFVQTKVANAVPSIGHRCLGKLVIDGVIEEVFTTNFDELIESGIQVAKPGHSVLVLSPEKHDRISELSRADFPKVIKLHGDYRYDSLKNTSEELKALDASLSNYFKECLKVKGLVLCGYSGSDDSVLSALEAVVEEKASLPHGLVWCLRANQEPNERVLKLVSRSRAKNEHSGFLYIDNFDEFSYRLYSRTCRQVPEIEKEARLLVDKKLPFQMAVSTPEQSPFILNSIEISKFPTTAYSVNSGELKWANIKALGPRPNVVLSLFKGRLYAWGEGGAVQSVLKELGILQPATIGDLRDSKLYEDSSFYQGMIYDALIIFFERQGCKRGRRATVFDPQRAITQRVPPGYNCNEAVEFQVSMTDKRLRLILAPTAFVRAKVSKKGVERDDNITSTVNAIKSNRYNAIVGQLLREWRDRLFPNNTSQYRIGEFEFEFKTAFSFAGYPQTEQTFFFKRGKSYAEPTVAFHPTDSGKQTIHPLKGMAQYCPYEFNLSGSSSPVRMAILTGKNYFAEIKGHLDGLNSPQSSTEAKEQYLIDYPGFYEAYKAPLDVPTSENDPRVLLVKDADIQGKSCIEFYELVKRSVDSFSSIRHLFDVLVIYVPRDWARFREQKDDTLYFDLHDSVKLYAAKKNVKIQFVERKSLDYQDQLRVKWWLSQGLYVKGSGIPWKVSPTAPNTAFVGLGYALRDGKTLLAASQLFDEKGQGLRVLLQPIRNHVFIGKNPFMSKDDARRLVTTLRESYFASGVNSKLDRIVIHKSNFFNRDEIEGITQALDGIQNIELVQIQEANLWRGLRWNSERRNGKWINKSPDAPFHGFPIQRGAAVQIDDFATLLWTDGSVQHRDLNKPTWNYFQSARGIPSPLMIKRFMGTDPVDIVLQDILKLTKMNWNSGQLYKRLPVTIEFSKILAEMAKQSEQLNGSFAYDFRYFI